MDFIKGFFQTINFKYEWAHSFNYEKHKMLCGFIKKLYKILIFWIILSGNFKRRVGDRMEFEPQPETISQNLPNTLNITRRFTTPLRNPLDEVEYELRKSVIKEPTGKVVFEMENCEIPKNWTQLATDIAVSKYFRKAGVPETGSEKSVKQLVFRIANTIRVEGEKRGYFGTKEDADAFEAELSHLLVNQRGAFNSPVWFNCGLWHQYHIKGSGGSWAWDENTKDVQQTENSYAHPQCSACFIQPVTDDLMGIFDLLKAEARLFKFGSGTGSNFSKIRSRYEKLSGGGTSSGLMSFLEVFDRGAGATKSGGTTRRAAKMVCLDLDHPEIVDFINWKVKEEKKAKTLIAAGYPSDFNGEAYHTVSGQNSNNSVRITDSFMQAVLNKAKWQTTFRTTGEVHQEYEAADLMKQVCNAAWECADPGVQFDTIINDWHTCPNSDRIFGSNPCVTGDTKVLTKEGRWIRIDAMLDQETTLLTNTGFIQEAPIKGSFRTGNKPVYRLSTKNGYELKVTGDHKIFTVNRGFVQACELTKDDHVLLPAQEVAEIPEIEDPTFYQMVGVYLGDGCGGNISSKRGIQITMSKQSELPILNRFSDYVASSYDRVTHKSSPATVQVTQTSGKYVVTNQTLISQFKELLDLSLLGHQKCVSEQIFALPLAQQKYVLQGLFTADGTVANYGAKSQYVALDSTSLQLLKDVQILLLGFGIKSKLYKNRRAGKNIALLPDGKGGMKEYAVKEMHSLRISRSSRLKFEELIGFMPESPKAKRLKELNEAVGVYQDKPIDAVESLVYLGEEDVYDLTEPMTHTFVANGITIHNCSEYMFLDNTACNLASINLMKFASNDQNLIDIPAFKHACEMFILAQEIIVAFSSYPTKPIAAMSQKYRTLGLGFANLGTLLMVNGIPYDSEKARAIAGAITAIMCGTAYEMSAKIAGVMGPFSGYQQNREPMLRVMNKHREEAYKIDVRHCPKDLLTAARESWDAVVATGEQTGYRNAQVTVIAPTGTIGLLMDCDTTGVEPEFAIVKWKKLAGGGYFKIVNNSLLQALQSLGYDTQQVEDITTYVLGRGTLDAAPHVNPEALKKLGLTDEQITEARDYVAQMKSLDEWTPHINAKELRKLGLVAEQINEAVVYIGGAQTVEGAPHLKDEHLPVFDCANKCGVGKRFIAPMGHVKMMAAVQPFISGAISKTVNIPADTTVEDIEKIYFEAWKLGLKAIAPYRDGCKGSQPLNALKSEEDEEAATEAAPAEVAQKVLPKRRRGFTVESNLAGQNLKIVTGEFDDGSLGEFFVEMHKEGAAFRSMTNCLAKAVSIALQHNVPLERFVEALTFTRFEPNGMTDHPNIKTATSMVDFIFRVLGLEYLQRDDLVHVKPEKKEAAPKETATVAVAKDTPVPAEATSEAPSTDGQLSNQLKDMMGDAPPCNSCGHTTVRNGTCYRCLSCGNSMGCS